MSEDKEAGPMELGPGVEVMRALASACWHVCPPYYTAVKYVAYRLHNRLDLGKTHKKALDRVYKY